MSSDSIVFDMASVADVQPSIFLKKDWLSVLDNQNSNYVGNQCVIDTSQIANSNKYVNYREGYLSMPLLLTITSPAGNAANGIQALQTATSCDYAVGLKNWYGSIIHSATLDYNGVTMIQQTPFIGMWNTFKLMTTLSADDLLTQGPSIGFYPDDASGVSYSTGYTLQGLGTANNNNQFVAPVVSTLFNSFGVSNLALYKRQIAFNLNPDGLTAPTAGAFSTLITAASLQACWKSYIFTKLDVAVGAAGVWQCAIMSQIKLKHLHSFFERMPLIKGAFMKLTLALNQSSVTLGTSATGVANAVTVNSPLGGVSPIMLASRDTGAGGAAVWRGAATNTISLAVGNRVLNATQSGVGGVGTGPLSTSVQLYIPAYSFNPVFESAYISSPIKQIAYTDVYQYTVLNVGTGQNFNNLISNGISGIKSVLVLPFFTSTANAGLSPFQSPFDPAGAGPTSPLALLGNFNVQISGQNQIYNTQKYSYENFMNQLAGVNNTNGAQTDGLASGLVSQFDFETEYCYYYVNCGRCLPVEEAVPKSVSIQGTNLCALNVDLYVFVEYAPPVVSIDVISGTRV